MKFLNICLAVMTLILSDQRLANAQSTKPIVLGSTPGIQSTLIMVAQANHLFEKAGLDVKTVRVISGQRGLETLLGGQLDLSFMAEYPPVIGALRQQKFGIVATISEYVANRVISTAAVGFKTMKDLAGKKIGTTLATNEDYFTELELEKAGITAQIVNVAPTDIVPALARGEIDAGIMFPDYYPHAKAVLGDKYREYVSGDYQSYYVIAASPAMIARTDDLKKFLSVLAEADKIVQTDPAGAQATIVKVSGGLLDPKVVSSTWSQYVIGLSLDQSLVDTMTSEAEWVHSKGLIQGPASEAVIRSYIVDAPLRSVAPAKVKLSS